MKRLITAIGLLFSVTCFSQTAPELLYYKFDSTSPSVTVPNWASAPPSGTTNATIMGSLTQGPSGQCGNAIIGSGNASSTDYVNTGYATNLTGTSWTISFWTKDITPSSTLFYIFGDATASSFRCFTNGVAGANNWILRGGLTDVLLTGGATVAPHMTTFVYDISAGNIKAYLDGVLNNTVAQAGPSITGTGPFKVIGYASNVGCPAGGKLDEFRMYSRALSPTEIMQLYTHNVTNTITTTACNSYTVPSGNMTYTASGTYQDTIPRVYCGDSLLTINLTINNATSSSFNVTACGSYTVPSGDETYTTSGTRMDTIPNSVGCDSIMTITMAINSLPVVSLSGNNAFCAGDSTLLTGTSGGTSQWYMNGMPISGANTNTYYATAPGVYNMTKTNLNGCTDSAAVGITVTQNPLPAVSYSENQNMVCVNWPTITLTPGTPGGGAYSGTAVSGNTFDPTTAGAGTFAIVYTYTDGNGCTNSDTSMITVDLCTGIDDPNDVSFSIFPNPGAGIFMINSTHTADEIVVSDLLGKEVLRVAPISKNTEIDLSRESSGIYTVTIRSGNSIHVRKLVLNK
ncbi:MAG TPA: LamG-like jellyroll fold domain-containing protein [Bacteroidia bacterium]|jgi:hypothetical protein